MIGTLRKKIYLIAKKQGVGFGIDFPYFVKNGFWVMTRQIIVAITGLTTLVILTRYTSQEIFGKYQFILSVLSLVMIFSLPGMGTSLVQAIAQGKDGFYKQAFRLSMRASLTGSIVLTLVGAYFLYSDIQLASGFLLIAFLFPFLSVFFLWESFLQGKERFDLVTRNATSLSILQVVMMGVAVFLFPRHLTALILAYGLSAMLLNIYFYRSSLSLVKNDVSDDQSVRFGYFMTKMNAIGIISEQIDKILIGVLLGPVQLAVYAVVSFFGVRIKEVMRSFTSMLVPKMTTGKYLFHEILFLHKKTMLALLFGMVGFSLGFYFLVNFVNVLMFSRFYQDYGYLSQWYVCTIMLSVPLTFMGYYVSAKQNKYAITLSNTFFHVIRIVLSIVLISLYGLLGAVVAYNVSMILLLFVYSWGIYREERVISLPQ